MASVILVIAFALLLVFASTRAGIVAGRQNEKFALPFDWRSALEAAFVEACALLAGAIIGGVFLALIGFAGFMGFVMFGGLL